MLFSKADVPTNVFSHLIACAIKIYDLDPVLTQNGIGTGRAGRRQWKIRRANGGKKHKSEPKRLRFALETTYGPAEIGKVASTRTI